jgi:solute carrier family 6 amino acid/orphan transporter-like 15/16/17/18/20
MRRQSSRDLKPQKSVDKLEMKEMRGRLVVESRKSNITANYGATNAGFEDSSPSAKVRFSDFTSQITLLADCC